MEFYAGARDMRDFKAGIAIKDGYKFKEVGEKKMVVRLGDYVTTYTMNVSK